MSHKWWLPYKRDPRGFLPDLYSWWYDDDNDDYEAENDNGGEIEVMGEKKREVGW